MPRRTRLFVPGQTQHVIQRGNNRGAIFFEDSDRRFYLSWLGEALVDQGCALHAYVLMTNHVHLLITADREEAVPKVLQSLGRRYVRHVNRAYGRTGTLWEGRYKSTRASMVADAGNYPWSSFHHNACGRVDSLLPDHPIYAALGATDAERQATYRALFAQALDPDLVKEIRDATNRGWVPGSERFRKEIEAVINRRLDPPRRGRPPRVQNDPDHGKVSQCSLI